MISCPKGAGPITIASPGIGAVHHADHFARRRIVISPADWEQQSNLLIVHCNESF